MRLSVVNFFKKTVPGHIFRGKKRLVRPVTQKCIENQIRDYERQETNMLILRHPYLTLEESSGHAKSLNKRETLVKKWQDEQTLSKMKPHIRLEDRLLHLNIKSVWD